MELPLQPALVVSGAQIQGIIESVRNVVLDWSLRLEAQGILGEGMTFSKEEKAAAGNVTYQVQNLIHNMSHSQIQQDSSGSQVIADGQVDYQKIDSVLEQILKRIDDLGLNHDQKGEISADVATIQAQVKSPKPKSAVAREALRSLRSILENAAASAAAAEILAKVKELLL